MKKNILSRVLPFGVFVSLIGLQEVIALFDRWGMIHLDLGRATLFLYPLRAVLAGLAVILFWRSYDEINFNDLKKLRNLGVGLVAGVLVFVLWINLDWEVNIGGSAIPFDPSALGSGLPKAGIIIIRTLSASLIVPVIEEVFWRSFLIRWIEDPDFQKVSIGHFTWFAFIITSVLFGLEHNLVIAGITAGIVYSLVLYYTKSISSCILAHASTNLILALYVVYTGSWRFW